MNYPKFWEHCLKLGKVFHLSELVNLARLTLLFVWRLLASIYYLLWVFTSLVSVLVHTLLWCVPTPFPLQLFHILYKLKLYCLLISLMKSTNLPLSEVYKIFFPSQICCPKIQYLFLPLIALLWEFSFINLFQEEHKFCFLSICSIMRILFPHFL